LAQLREVPLTESRLHAAQKQLVGQILIAGDNFESYALALGKTFAHTGKHRDVDEIIRHVRSVTSEDILRAAQDIFAEEKLTTLIYK
jgi:predicted Zn-dependent peptidase